MEIVEESKSISRHDVNIDTTEAETQRIDETSTNNNNNEEQINGNNEEQTNGNNETTTIPSSSSTLSASQYIEEENNHEERFCWRQFLIANPRHDIEHVPVSSFYGAPLSDGYERYAARDIKVEFLMGTDFSTDRATYSKVFWIGTPRKYFGYLAKVEEEGYPRSMLETPYRWLNFLTDCFQIGNCYDLQDSVLTPPLNIMYTKEENYWKQLIFDRVTGQSTIHKTVAETFQAYNQFRLEVGTMVEVTDHKNTSRMKQGYVTEFKGSRHFIRYWDAEQDAPNDSNSGLWCDILESDSWRTFPPGWCKATGHDLSAQEDYDQYDHTVTDDFFEEDGEITEAKVGQKLEALFPFHCSRITAATVVKVLKHGFIMVSPDSPLEKNKKEESTNDNNNFCYSIKSPLIFPCGFSQKLGIELLQPKGYPSKKFSWEGYFATTGETPLPIKRDLETPSHGFKIGLRLEAVDVTNPSMIRVATIIDNKGPLVQIVFDGTPRSQSQGQWMHYKSHYLYPVTFCDTFNYPLYGPKKNAKFWKKYKYPGTYMPVPEDARIRGSLAEFKKAKKGRKIDSDLFEKTVFNSDLVKTDAIKLGSGGAKRKVSRSTLDDELRANLNPPAKKHKEQKKP